MEFIIKDFHAVPDAGFFDGNIRVRNFLSPEIEMDVNSDFNLNFLSSFLGLKDLRDMSGKVSLKMKFHDIVDIDRPERMISRLNEAYESKLIIKDLSFKKGTFYLPIESIQLGTEVSFEVRGKLETATVAPYPFYKRTR